MGLSTGDHFFLIQQKGSQHEIIDVQDVRPRMRRGTVFIRNYPIDAQKTITMEFFCRDEETPEEYNDYWEIMWGYVDRGMMYISKSNKQKSHYSLKQS